MPPAEVNSFTRDLVSEYDRARATLLRDLALPRDQAYITGHIQATLSLCTVNQAEIIVSDLNSALVAGIYIEADFLKDTIPAYTGVDVNRISSTHLNRISTDTIGYIGRTNKELEKALKAEYKRLLANNQLVTQLKERGWSQQIGKKLAALGYSDDIINLVKSQTTANKMAAILEMNGMRGGMHPNDISKLLRPYIRDVFGDGGVLIDNIGKTRLKLVVNADGKYEMIKQTVTNPYRTTVNNYADTIARSSMLKAQNEGRVATLQQSGFCEEKYRFIAAMSGNTCATCAMMNGQIVNPYEVTPPIHAKCGCRLAPIWKKETGLTNHTDEYYETQRNQWFWKQHQTKAFNKTLPRELRITNYNYLPPELTGGMPTGAEMREIRRTLLPSVA